MHYKRKKINNIILICTVFFIVFAFFNTLSYASRKILFERERIITIEYPDVKEGKIIKHFPKKEGKVNIQFYAESDTVVRGQIIDVKLVLSWLGSEDLYRIKPSKLKLINLILENVSISTVREEKGEGALYKKIISYSLRGLDAGAGTIESFKCEFYRKGSPSPYVVTIPESVLPIVDIQWDNNTKMIVSALLLGAILILILIVSRDISLPKRKKKVEGKQPDINIKIEQISKKLDELKPVISQGDGKAFFTKLSEILYDYLKEEYSLNDEGNIIDKIQEIDDLSSNNKLMFKNIFELYEKVNFAGYKCERGEIESLLQGVINFIQGKRII